MIRHGIYSFVPHLATSEFRNILFFLPPFYLPKLMQKKMDFLLNDKINSQLIFWTNVLSVNFVNQRIFSPFEKDIEIINAENFEKKLKFREDTINKVIEGLSKTNNLMRNLLFDINLIEDFRRSKEIFQDGNVKFQNSAFPFWKYMMKNNFNLIMVSSKKTDDQIAEENGKNFSTGALNILRKRMGKVFYEELIHPVQTKLIRNNYIVKVIKENEKEKREMKRKQNFAPENYQFIKNQEIDEYGYSPILLTAEEKINFAGKFPVFMLKQVPFTRKPFQLQFSNAENAFHEDSKDPEKLKLENPQNIPTYLIPNKGLFDFKPLKLACSRGIQEACTINGKKDTDALYFFPGQKVISPKPTSEFIPNENGEQESVTLNVPNDESVEAFISSLKQKKLSDYTLESLIQVLKDYDINVEQIPKQGTKLTTKDIEKYINSY